MSNYWQNRMVKAHDALQNKTIKQIEAQLAKYYKQTMKTVIADFEALLDKLIATMEEGREPTVADLYKLNKYWSMQGQLRNELQKLGELEAALLSEQFEKQWLGVYKLTEQELLDYFDGRAEQKPDKLKEIYWQPEPYFSTISTENAQQMINQVWCADGKTWSDRVWKNVEDLAQQLNDKLIEAVVTGKDTTALKKDLAKRFDVSFSRADTLIRTETAHITTQAAAKRYKDYGLEKYEILGREEADGCGHEPDCHDMNGKQFLYSEMRVGVNAPPFHPNCRCALTAVIEDNEREEIMEEKKTDIEALIRELERDGMSRENIKRIEEQARQGRTTFTDLVTYDRKCGDCGKTIKSLYPRGFVLCDDCKEERKWNKQYEFVKCSECGTLFKRKKQGGNKTMCDDCYTEYRKKYRAAKAREYRKKKKLNK